MSKAKHNIISYAKIDIDNIVFNELQSTDRVPSQDIGYMGYKDDKNGERQFDIQTPEIKMDAGGIPDADSPYHQTISQRAFVKIPLEVNPNVKGETDEERNIRAEKLEKFKNALIKIDNYMDSEEFKTKTFGKNHKKYKLQPIARTPEIKDSDSDSEDENQNEDKVIKHKPMYMKAKIPMVYGEDKVDLDVYRVNEEGTTDFENDGKWTEIKNIETLDDLKKNGISYMRNVKFVLHACKFWAQKQASSGSSTRLYGLTFKARRVEVKPQPQMNDDNSDDDDELFANSDDDEIVEKFVAQSKVNRVNQSEEEENDDDNDDNDDNSDDDSDDSEPEKNIVADKKQPVKRSRKKTSNN